MSAVTPASPAAPAESAPTHGADKPAAEPSAPTPASAPASAGSSASAAGPGSAAAPSSTEGNIAQAKEVNAECSKAGYTSSACRDAAMQHKLAIGLSRESLVLSPRQKLFADHHVCFLSGQSLGSRRCCSLGIGYGGGGRGSKRKRRRRRRRRRRRPRTMHSERN